ncbi:MAG: hypothetical protein WCG06_06690, partial [Candidatus Omnitrophota bacterium]
MVADYWSKKSEGNIETTQVTRCYSAVSLIEALASRIDMFLIEKFGAVVDSPDIIAAEALGHAVRAFDAGIASLTVADVSKKAQGHATKAYLFSNDGIDALSVLNDALAQLAASDVIRIRSAAAGSIERALETLKGAWEKNSYELVDDSDLPSQKYKLREATLRSQIHQLRTLLEMKLRRSSEAATALREIILEAASAKTYSELTDFRQEVWARFSARANDFGPAEFDDLMAMIPLDLDDLYLLHIYEFLRAEPGTTIDDVYEVAGKEFHEKIGQSVDLKSLFVAQADADSVMRQVRKRFERRYRPLVGTTMLPRRVVSERDASGSTQNEKPKEVLRQGEQNQLSISEVLQALEADPTQVEKLNRWSEGVLPWTQIDYPSRASKIRESLSRVRMSQESFSETVAEKFESRKKGLQPRIKEEQSGNLASLWNTRQVFRKECDKLHLLLKDQIKRIKPILFEEIGRIQMLQERVRAYQGGLGLAWLSGVEQNLKVLADELAGLTSERSESFLSKEAFDALVAQT